MRELWKTAAVESLLALALAPTGFSQTVLTWQQVRNKFESPNLLLRAAQISIDESRAREVRALLRLNPSFTPRVDQINPFTTNPWQPLVNAPPFESVSYLLERQHKWELPLQIAKDGTEITSFQTAGTLIFNLGAAFIQTFQEKAVLVLASNQSVKIARVAPDQLELQPANQLNLAVGREVIP